MCNFLYIYIIYILRSEKSRPLSFSPVGIHAYDASLACAIFLVNLSVWYSSLAQHIVTASMESTVDIIHMLIGDGLFIHRDLSDMFILSLFKKNICSALFLRGRYVETAAIETALARVAKLYASTSGGDSVQLALAAGFEMDASGGVHSVSSAGSASRFPHAPPARSGGRQARPGGREGSRARSSGGGWLNK